MDDQALDDDRWTGTTCSLKLIDFRLWWFPLSGLHPSHNQQYLWSSPTHQHDISATDGSTSILIQYMHSEFTCCIVVELRRVPLMVYRGSICLVFLHARYFIYTSNHVSPLQYNCDQNATTLHRSRLALSLLCFRPKWRCYHTDTVPTVKDTITIWLRGD